jgi:gas vesicle protein
MSNRDGFASGLIAGAAVGGLVGGLLGVLLASRVSNDNHGTEENLLPRQDTEKQKATTEAEIIEAGRQSLENKIAQLNQAIDDVRQQIGGVNGNVEKTERSLSEES